MKRIQILRVMLVFILLGGTSIARASAIMFTDRTAWQAEVLSLGYSLTNIDFENAVVSTGDTVTAVDVIFSSPGVPLEVREDYGIPYGSGNVLYPAFNQPLQIQLPISVFAFGFHLGELEPLFDSVATLSNVVLSTGDVFAGPFEGNPFPTFAFFGFSSDLPIVSLSMAPHAIVEPILDNFTYAQASDTLPEPSSLLLLCFGLFGLVANAWRNRRREGE